MHSLKKKKMPFGLHGQREACRAACCSAWATLVHFSPMQISFFNLLWVFSFSVGLDCFCFGGFVCLCVALLVGWLLFGWGGNVFLFVWIFCLVFGFGLGFFLSSTDILIIPSIKKLHHCRSEGKAITLKSNRNLFKARRQEVLCSSLGRRQGMEQVTCLKGTRWILHHSMVGDKVN